MAIDAENFDARMAQVQPTLQLRVENTLNADGTFIDMDLDFQSMSDFEPAQVIKKIPELAVLLDARNRLKELIMYMDGKSSAEEVVEELLRRNGAAAGTGEASAPAANGPHGAAKDESPEGAE